MAYQTIIGLEIHVELNTKSKMFSNAPVSFGKEANTNVAPLDLAFPGTMPTVNKEAVIFAIRLCHALNMKIENTLIFERKNYFYSDLPKGYQITQKSHPIGRDGTLSIDKNSIRIESISLEEDTCKQVHIGDSTYIDYNRAGIPLVEIVTKPDIRNGLEAKKFVEEIRSIVTSLGISDGKMEEGSLRCDVNLSVREEDSDELGTKVEIKNLNSCENILKAVEYESKYQIATISSGKKIIQETLRFDEKEQKTVPMRIKLDSIDYKFFIDPNIVPINLSKEFIDEAINNSPELANNRLNRYLSYGLSNMDASRLSNNVELSIYFDECLKYLYSPKLVANWINQDIQNYLNEHSISINEFPLPSKKLVELLSLIENKTISNKQAREVFAKMINGGLSAIDIVKSSNMNQISDTNSLNEMITKLINDNPKVVIDYKAGKDRVIGYLTGQVMKLTNGKANPSLVSQLIKDEIKRR